MKTKLKTLIKKHVPVSHHGTLIKLKNWLTDGSSVRSYSQEGEDMILRRIFEKKESGFYVDIGAHHPKRFSNTYYFYKKGWRGINVDAMPGSMKAFGRVRPRDINLEIPVSDKNETLVYYAFNDPALNGFSKELSDARKNSPHYTVLFEKEMQTQTLAQILQVHLPSEQAIDFMSVDVEGMDFEVLQSNDWQQFRPKVVLVEVRNLSLENMYDSKIVHYLGLNGYCLYAKTVCTLIFFERSDGK